MKKLWDGVQKHYELIGYVILTVLLFLACFVDAFAWVAAVFAVLFALVLRRETKLVGLTLFLHCFYAIFFHHKLWGITLDIVLVGVLAIMLLVQYFIRVIRKEQKVNWKTLVLIALFLVYVALPFHECAWQDYFAVVFFFVLVYVVFEERRQIDFRQIVRIFVWGLVLSCGFALFRNVSPVLVDKIALIDSYGKLRFQGLTYHPNTLTKLLILAISAMLLLKCKNKISWTELEVALVPLFVFGYLTISRSFLVVAAVTVLVFTVFYFLQSKVKACAFLGITLAFMCAVGGVFWSVTKIYFEKVADKPISTSEVNCCKIGTDNFTDLTTAKFVGYFDGQSPEWQQDTLLGKNSYDPGRLGLQELYLRDWSASTKTIWLGRGISRPLIGQMSAHNLFVQELWKHGLVGYFFYLAMILCSINWKKLKKIKFYWALLIVLIPHIMIALIEQCLLDYIGLFVIFAALGWVEQTEQKTEYTLYQQYVKRFFDITLSGLGLLILSPLFLIIAILSKIFIRGKVIYEQPRPGKNGQIFKLYKFRSMSDKRGTSGALLPDSERLTKFGKILRRLSLDELPQLVNILRGDMSIVGPRPLPMKYLPYYPQAVLPGYSVRPGLTGLDQVSGGRSDSSWETIFQKNLEYQQQITFWGDVKILLLTVLEIFKKNNAANGAEAAQRDYYYDVYLLRTKQISQKQYDLGHARAAQLIAERGVVEFQADLQPENKKSGKVADKNNNPANDNDDIDNAAKEQ